MLRAENHTAKRYGMRDRHICGVSGFGAKTYFDAEMGDFLRSAISERCAETLAWMAAKKARLRPGKTIERCGLIDFPLGLKIPRS